MMEGNHLQYPPAGTVHTALYALYTLPYLPVLQPLPQAQLWRDIKPTIGDHAHLSSSSLSTSAPTSNMPNPSPSLVLHSILSLRNIIREAQTDELLRRADYQVKPRPASPSLAPRFFERTPSKCQLDQECSCTSADATGALYKHSPRMHGVQPQDYVLP